MGLGISGSRNLKEVPQDFISWWKNTTQKVDVVYNGGCIGADAIVGKWLHDRHPEALHIPILPTNRSKVDMSVLQWSSAVMEMLPGTTYKDRNQMIVDLSTAMVFFPEYPEGHSHSVRSGTWQTFRMAQRAGIPTKVFVLNDDH